MGKSILGKVARFQPSSGMNRSALGVVAIIFAALVLVAGIGGIGIWLKISALKKSLVANLEESLGAKVEIASLHLDLWHGELQAANITLVNQRPDAPWEKGEVSQATLRFHLGDLFSSNLPLSVEVSSWNVVLHPYAVGVSAITIPAFPPSSHAIRVTQLSARQGEIEIQLSDNKKVVFHGVAFESSNNGAEVWDTQLQASSIVSGTLQAGSSSVQIRGDRDKVTFSNLRMHCGPSDGMITGDGEMALNEHHAAHARLTATGVPVTQLVGIPWQLKLSGLVNGDLTYEGNDQSSSARGHMTVSDGKFNVLPWLGKVTALVNLPDITDMQVDQASSDLNWKDHAFHLTNIDIRKNDITRISGDVVIDPTGQVDGHLKLGLPSTVTAKWPQLQDKVFSDQREDYNWADVHLTGPPDHLQEDLTSRGLAVGMDQGSGLINQTSQKAMDLLKGFLGN